jgi:L-ascorbate metabolism protein UlaG (beta-lactamase superfamily)
MIIQFYGNQFFRIQFGDLVIAYNPISKDSKQKSAKFGADIALTSFNHPDLNGISEMSYGDREPFPIFGPGEYEVKDVFIKGFSSPGNYAGKDGLNTVYQVSLEGMNLLFLGALGSTDLDPKVKEGLEDVDILFVPVDGGAISASEAYKLSVKLEPKLIVPMSYTNVKDQGLTTFLKEGGDEKAKAEDKLTIKKKDVVDSEGEIKLLNPQAG